MSRRTARIRMIASVLVLLALVLLSGCAVAGQLNSEPWPPSTSGRPVMYYFGDPG